MLIPLLWALLRSQLLWRCSGQSRMRGNSAHVQPLGAPGEETCVKKDGAEGVLDPWLHLSCCHRNGTLKQYWCCVFSQCEGAVVPTSILTGISAWSSSGFLWSMADSQVLQGPMGCSPHQGLTTYLGLYHQMWRTVEMDKWRHSWEHP